MDLITELDNSHSYATTHAVIAKLHKLDSWDNDEREKLFDIAVRNSQVYGVLKDPDVEAFYTMLLGKAKALNDNAKEIKKIIES